jgi:medium-chain acyl-[acyl-carrier-protein] hydrolase
MPGAARRSFTLGCNKRITPLTQAVTEVLLPHLTKPFAFFGHSMGALVAFEAARLLRKMSLPQPLHLFVSGSSAPHLKSERKLWHNLPDAQLIEELRHLNGTPPEVLDNQELVSLFLPIIRADFAVCDNYVYASGEPLHCLLSAFAGADDRNAGPERCAAWRQHTTSDFSLRVLAGDHFFLHTSQAELVNTIAHALRQHYAVQTR